MQSGNVLYGDAICPPLLQVPVVRRLYDVNVPITPPEENLHKESIILLNQIRTVDKSRLERKLGSISRATMKRADRALKISLELRD